MSDRHMLGRMAGNTPTALCGTALPKFDPPITVLPELVDCEACKRKILAQRNAMSATVKRSAKGKS